MAQQKRKILIVDDDRDFLLAMRVRLEASGYSVSEAAGADTALTIVDAEPPPDLILLDIGLPAGNGIMLLDCFRMTNSVRNVPVIILTAQPAPFLRHEAEQRGVVGFFQKPADNMELLQAIRKALGE
jgi:CheY-like chemotaxis protein